MSVLGRKRRDLDSQDQDQSWDRERADAEVKQEIPGMPAFPTPSKNMSPPPRKASKPSPCSSGKSASSEPRSPRNKGSVSSETRSMTAELAATSKTPHRDKAPLASRCNKVHRVKSHSNHRSEHVKHRGLNRSTDGEASGQRQRRCILEMKHLFRKKNTERITDSERPAAAETLDFLGGNAALLHLPTLEKLLRKSKEEEAEEEEEEEEEDLCSSGQHTYRETTFPLSASHQSSAAGGFYHTPESLGSLFGMSADSPVSGDGYSLKPFLGQISQPRVPLIPSRAQGGVQARTQQTSSLPKRPRSRRTSPTGSFCQREPPPVDTEEDHGLPAYTLWSSKEPWRQSPAAPAQTGGLTVSGVFGDIKKQVHVSECPTASGGAAAAAQSSQSLEETSRLIVCRPKQSLLLARKEEEEEEEDQCRICHSSEDSTDNQLISPCRCSGSMKFIHFECLKTWLRTKIEAGHYIISVCELCKGIFRLEPQKLDLNRFFVEERKKVQQARMRELQEAAAVLNFTTRISRGLDLRRLPHPRPVLRVSIWPSFPLLIRLRRLRERRIPSPEASDS